MACVAGVLALSCGEGRPRPSLDGGDAGGIQLGGGGATGAGGRLQTGGAIQAGGATQVVGDGGVTDSGATDGPTGPHCGDGVRQLERGERCDDGPSGSDECTTECLATLEALFDARALPTFYIHVPEESWAVLSSCTEPEAHEKAPPPECDYQQASFHAVFDPDPGDGVAETRTTAPAPVGLRRKGRATWSDLDDKPSWKLKFTEFGGTRFLGLSRLTLNNMKQDPSGLRERLGYELFRAMGTAAPLANNARVFLRVGDESADRDQGIYVNVQTVDKQFAQHNYGEVNGAVGNLYDTYNDVYFTDIDRSSSRDQAGLLPGAQEARFQLETNEVPGDTSDLTALLDAVYVPQPDGRSETFWSEVNAELSGDEFLDAFAMMAVLADWDGFAGARNNYKIYHELGRDRFVLIPWGIDQTFGQRDEGGPTYFPNWAYPIDHSGSRRERAFLFLRCLNDTDGCQARYRDAVGRAATVFESLGLEQKITEMRDQIEPHVDWEPDTFTRFADYLAQFARERPSCVRSQLAGEPCAVLACPAPDPSCSGRR